jgi:hypothetical protein
MIEIIGFAPHDDGNAEESHTTRFRTACVSPRELRVDLRGSVPIFVVACACADVTVVR